MTLIFAPRWPVAAPADLNSKVWDDNGIGDIGTRLRIPAWLWQRQWAFRLFERSRILWLEWQLLPLAAAEDPRKADGLARTAATNCLWLETALAPGNEHYFSTEIFYPYAFGSRRWDGDSTPVV